MWILEVRTAERAPQRAAMTTDCHSLPGQAIAEAEQRSQEMKVRMTPLPHKESNVSLIPALPELDWPCFTHVAKVWWKFLFCWNVTVAGDPTLVASTIFVPGVTEPLKGATITF